MAVIALIALFSSIFFGAAGLRIALGFILGFLPFYFLLERTTLDGGEKILFSSFLALGIFPSLVYWVGTLISFKGAIFTSFLILAGFAATIRLRTKKRAIQDGQMQSHEEGEMMP